MTNNNNNLLLETSKLIITDNSLRQFQQLVRMPYEYCGYIDIKKCVGHCAKDRTISKKSIKITNINKLNVTTRSNSSKDYCNPDIKHISDSTDFAVTWHTHPNNDVNI